MNRDQVHAICQAAGVESFESTQYSGATYKGRAQTALTGRTHYVDDSTLRFHHSRISNASAISADGYGIFFITESVSRDFNNTSRGFRCVAFDLFGTVVQTETLGSLHSSSAKAEKAFWARYNEFNANAHYREVLSKRAADLRKQADQFVLTATVL